MPALREALRGAKDPEASLVPSLPGSVTPSELCHLSMAGGDSTAGGAVCISQVLQRNRTSRVCVCVCKCARKLILRN